ncbi:MAG: hypothetical protein QXJ11_01860 [Candidatus Bathyarchaeia archaeon]
MSSTERTDLLRNAINPFKGGQQNMGTKNKKTQRKVNLLEVSDTEKIRLIREIKQNLRQMAVEAKLWQSFVNAESITINGETIQWKNMELEGLTLNEF